MSLTDAVFVKPPVTPASTVTSMVTTVAWPAPNPVPGSEHVTVPDASAQVKPFVALALTKVTSAGSSSVMVIPVGAAASPTLETVTEYVKVSPAVTVPVLAFLLMLRLGAGGGATTVVLVLQLSSSLVSSISWSGSMQASLSSAPSSAVMNTWTVMSTTCPGSRSPTQVTRLTGFSCVSQAMFVALPATDSAETDSGISPTGR